MNILVTGGAGYIGSVVAAQLLDAGHGVVVYDSLARGHRSAVPQKADFIQADLADREALGSALSDHRTEAIMHFAALIESGESMETPATFFHNNVGGTANLLDMASDHGVERFVLSSSADIYGVPVRERIRETDPLEPINPYGESKLLVERMLAWTERIHGLRYASLRYFNAAGATAERGEDHRPESHLIPRVLAVALGQQDRLEIFGTDYPTPDGTCVRDYIHVSDLAEAHLLALEALKNGSVVFNVGTGRGHSVREVLETARRVTGHPISSTERPRRPGDSPVKIASPERIQAELSWRPRFPELESILETAWRWRRDRPHGYPD
ncbi:MAG: UDP-glucose 4-epimerase GalE [Anaerolineae bacterium]